MVRYARGQEGRGCKRSIPAAHLALVHVASVALTLVERTSVTLRGRGGAAAEVGEGSGAGSRVAGATSELSQAAHGLQALWIRTRQPRTQETKVKCAVGGDMQRLVGMVN